MMYSDRAVMLRLGFGPEWMVGLNIQKQLSLFENPKRRSSSKRENGNDE